MKHVLPLVLINAAVLFSTALAGPVWQHVTEHGGKLSVVTAPQITPAAAKAGWQGIFLYTVPTGTVSLEFTYPCPASFPVAASGGYEFAGAAQDNQPVYLTASAPRLDEGPKTGFTGWADHFFFPNGALAGTQIWFDTYCK